jgi:DNA-binding NarL/FixJ family response regulator
VLEAERHVRAGTSVVVLGVPGSGRSYLAARVVESVPDLKVVAVRSATSTPGLIVSSVHDPSRAAGPGSVRRIPTVAAGAEDLAALGGTASAAGATVVLADDAHLLDEDHLQMLCDLASDGRIVLVATTDTPSTAPTARAAAVARLTSLWMDAGAGRIDLTGLSDADGHDLVRSVAGSGRLDLAVRHAILAASGGSPVTIRELTLDALRRDRAAADRDLLGIHGTGHLPPRVAERARRRLASLSTEDRRALVLLWRLDGFDPERAARYVGEGTLRRLVRHGCVTPTGAGSSTLRATPVDAEAVLLDDPDGSSGPQLARALQSMIELDGAGVVLGPFECLVLSDAWVESAGGPQSVTPSVTPQQVRRISTEAARKANAMLQPYGALSHAMLALDSAVSPDSAGSGDRTRSDALGGSGRAAAAVEASRALAALGSLGAAHDILGRGLEGLPVPHAQDAGEGPTAGPLSAPGPSEELELLALWRAELDDWDGDHGEGAGGDQAGADAADRPVRSVETLRSAVHALRAMHWREALEHARSLMEDDGAALVLRLRACALAGTSAAFLGHGAELESITTSGRQLHARLVAQAGSPTAQRVVDEGTAFFSASLAAHLACAVGLVFTPSRLDALMQRAVAARDVAHTSTLSALAGYVALAAGDDATAETEVGAALARAPRPSTHETHAWFVTMLAAALARLGRTAEADELCAAVEAPGTTTSRWSRYLVDSVRRLVDPTTAPPVAPTPWRAAEAAAQPTIALLAAAEAASSVDGSVRRQDLVDAATAAREQTDIGSLQAVADYVIAASTADAATLADLTRTFEGLGMRQLADACEEQAVRLLDPDSPHALSAWRDRASRSDGDGSEEALTTREREVAVLAGRGLSNREIAGRLFLSVRTVESHVYLARRKLGAASRRDLAGRLAELDGHHRS